MLAKVIKSGTESSVSLPFSIPTIGAEKEPSYGLGEFVLPSVDAFEYQAGPIDTDWTAETTGSLTADDILQHARDEAARIIAQAEEHSAIIEQVAADKAEHAAQANLEAKIADRVAGLRTQLAETIAKVGQLSSQMTANVEQDLVELALQIAKKVVAREVTIDREIALTLVKVSLGKLHNRSVAEVHLNPEDIAYVKGHIDKLDFRGSLELVEDKSISVGGCLIHTETGDIDARIESQFDEISHGLLT
ncbi:hypothetical protein BH10ACI2_BH10ACI2_06530 [soil metagenome]